MQRPSIKPEHLPFRIGADRVQIGGRVPGIAASIDDLDGWVWALLTLLDGTRSVDQVVADLVHRFPDYSEAEVREAVDDFYLAGHLYDAGVDGSGLSSIQQERYSRAQAWWRWIDLTPRTGNWDVQHALLGAKVTLIGVGGVGCAAATALVRSGVGRLHLVDADVVELSNLGRQLLYSAEDLGVPKVVAAGRHLRAVNDDVEITGEHLVVDEIAHLRRLASYCDVLLMAADTPAEIRAWTNAACLTTGTPWVHGGYHGPLIGVGVFRPGSGPCYQCARAAITEPIITAWPGDAGPLMHAASAVSAGIAGLMAAHLTMRLITGAPALKENREYRLNLATWRSKLAGAVEPGCPECSGTT